MCWSIRLFGSTNRIQCGYVCKGITLLLICYFLLQFVLIRRNIYPCQSKRPVRNYSSCKVHQENVTIFMDAFDWLNKKCFVDRYIKFVEAGQNCPPLPGGGICTFSTTDKCSDGILSYAVRSDVNYQRQHQDQIVIAFTMESEKGPHVHFPDNYDYDIKEIEPCSLLPVVNHHCHRVDQSLMEHLEIEQLGRCYQTKKVEVSDTRRLANWEDKKLEFLKTSKYKYILAFENTVEPDYITEKVYHGLLNDMIPIYYGDSAIFHLIPGNHTILYAPDYTPKQLAEYIKKIDNDEKLYASFFQNWDLKKIRTLHNKYCSEHFMCKVCRKTLELKYHQRGCSKLKL
ncbi:uncharacterized protein [Dysidea avara]|uniref:uncharacterized protein isoform X3 n=1 Tax=Dysidea avara TaxID=196820 RepID=UPI003332A0D5